MRHLGVTGRAKLGPGYHDVDQDWRGLQGHRRYSQRQAQVGHFVNEEHPSSITPSGLPSFRKPRRTLTATARQPTTAVHRHTLAPTCSPSEGGGAPRCVYVAVAAAEEEREIIIAVGSSNFTRKFREEICRVLSISGRDGGGGQHGPAGHAQGDAGERVKRLAAAVADVIIKRRNHVLEFFRTITCRRRHFSSCLSSCADSQKSDRELALSIFVDFGYKFLCPDQGSQGTCRFDIQEITL